MLSHGLFSLLTERLMLHSSQFSMTTYNVLFEVSRLPLLTLQACCSVQTETIRQQQYYTVVYTALSRVYNYNTFSLSYLLP